MFSGVFAAPNVSLNVFSASHDNDAASERLAFRMLYKDPPGAPTFATQYDERGWRFNRACCDAAVLAIAAQFGSNWPIPMAARAPNVAHNVVCDVVYNVNRYTHRTTQP